MFFRKKNPENLSIHYPIKGKAKKIEELGDGVFSELQLGDGFFVEPGEEKEVALHSVCDAKVESVFETKHALLLNAKGINVLIHFGLDTVELGGACFDVYVKDNQKVKAGQPLMKVNLEMIEKHGLRKECIVIFPEMDEYEFVLKNTDIAGMLEKK